MSKTNNSSKTNKKNDVTGCIAQLRRLKIQETIILSNVNKTYDDYLELCEENNKYNESNNDFKKYLSKLRNSFIDVKNLYEDIKIKTDFYETSEISDMNDLKKDILEFEEKMKTFKNFLREELNSAQLDEIALANKNIESHSVEKKYIRHPKVQSKCYKEIVPSPVRVLIKSPFKCMEIHQFQEFMKSSPNRYGGWNEYNHNLFVQIWDKYNGNDLFTSKSVEDTRVFQEFKHEILQKISGINIEDINSHCEWYSKYVYLKTCQQRALHKWKENKRKIKRPLREDKTIQNRHATINGIGTIPDKTFGSKLLISKNRKVSTDIGNDVIEMPRNVDVTKLIRPTEQWINRCQKTEKTFPVDFNIESITKLLIPTWRLSVKSAEKLE